MTRPLAALTLAATLAAAPGHGQSAYLAEVLDRVNLPEGFEIEVYAEVPHARTLVRNPADGVIYVGSRRGQIHSIWDADGDGRPDDIRERARGLKMPNGIAIRDGVFYLGLQDRVATWPLPEAPDLPRIGRLSTIYDGIDEGRYHGWRYIGFGPDDRLYLSLGAPCNICPLQDNTGKILRMAPDGSGAEIVADGVRNSVGFDWHPETGDFWFTDNGADGMGDDIPPDELNRVTRIGQHFGFPYLGGRDTPLTGYEGVTPPIPVTPAEIEFQAHTANLGIEFYEGDMFPAEYRNDAFVAQRGSWDRSEPVGYRIMRVRFDAAGNAIGKEVFADGWLVDGVTYGRVVDLEELPDGSLLVSDDFAGAVYRISYESGL